MYSYIYSVHTCMHSIHVQHIHTYIYTLSLSPPLPLNISYVYIYIWMYMYIHTHKILAELLWSKEWSQAGRCLTWCQSTSEVPQSDQTGAKYCVVCCVDDRAALLYAHTHTQKQPHGKSIFFSPFGTHKLSSWEIPCLKSPLMFFVF